VDETGSGAQKGTPEILGGSGLRSGRGVSGSGLILRPPWRQRRPRQAPTFAHVAA
jgi:hypothetical protein